ncbi:hypothetical protein [Bacillus solitudinis]|uniref:hypothetical protein n=1 Tax=Bacillus solitudinis TaxID=2014074 RepID=UPI000C246004|nr:hypothetical protein [Bacillus solitudinis]
MSKMAKFIFSRQEKLYLSVKDEKVMAWIGILGIVLGAICLVIILFKGSVTPPEGDLFKAVSFNVALGIFAITTAFLLPFSTFRPKSRSILRWSIIFLTLYSYSIETIQHLRGLNPRFSTSAGPLDIIFGALFGLFSIAIVIYYVIISINFFRKRTKVSRPLLVSGIRYGMLSTFIAFIGGLWMIALQGRYFGDSGNIIWLHGLAFHGLQIIPLIALLTEKTILSEKLKRRWIHISGVSWLSALLIIGIQTGIGISIFQISIPSVLALCLIGITATIFLQLLRSVIITKHISVTEGKKEFTEG